MPRVSASRTGRDDRHAACTPVRRREPLLRTATLTGSTRSDGLACGSVTFPSSDRDVQATNTSTIPSPGSVRAVRGHVGSFFFDRATRQGTVRDPWAERVRRRQCPTDAPPKRTDREARSALVRRIPAPERRLRRFGVGTRHPFDVRGTRIPPDHSSPARRTALVRIRGAQRDRRRSGSKCCVGRSAKNSAPVRAPRHHEQRVHQHEDDDGDRGEHPILQSPDACGRQIDRRQNRSPTTTGLTARIAP